MASTPALMLQGTGSSVGKSLLVAGLCRAFARRKLTVRPFKPQNMSNNAAVTADGGEIGRAQALQARACRIAPTIDMNPVLLKPQGEAKSQLVVHGRVEGVVSARGYQAMKAGLLPRVLESFARIGDGADLVLVEGAGSPAEINLRPGDIANMGFALAAEVPVLLVADISRGGSLASIAGTHLLLAEAERALLRGYIINRFRGDARLFDGAKPILERATGLACLGVVPEFADAHHLPAEDAQTLESLPAPNAAPIRIVVPRLPRIANFDDLDPLRAEPDVAVEIIAPGRPLPVEADLILLPGSKATRADLAALVQEGWDIDIKAARRRGARILGLCGGYQMLGTGINDPLGAEGPAGTSAGLGLLAVETTLAGDKTLTAVKGVSLTFGAAVTGYEMHLGVTTGADRARPFLSIDGRDEGAVSNDGLVAGTYLHGLFASDGFRAAFLAALRPERRAALAYEALVERTLDGLAQHLEASLPLDRLLAIARR